MRKENILELFREVYQGEKLPIDAYNKLMDILKISRKTILSSGDDLSKNNGYREDCQLIKDVLILNGYENAGLVDALYLWGLYSDSYAAGWMGLPEDDEIFNCISQYIGNNVYMGDLIK